MKTPIFILLFFSFYFLTLIQVGFLPHFGETGEFFMPVLVSVVLINIIEREKGNIGLLASVLGGFLLDVFSGGFLGFWTSISVAMAFLIKFFLKSYFQVSFHL